MAKRCHGQYRFSFPVFTKREEDLEIFQIFYAMFGVAFDTVGITVKMSHMEHSYFRYALDHVPQGIPDIG